MQDQLGRVAGIRRLAPSPRLEVFKFQSGLGPIVASQRGGLDLPDDGPLDALAVGAIRQLWIDLRATNHAIARKLHTSESTVRARIGNSRARHPAHHCVGNMPLGAGQVLAFVGIELDGRSRTAVARELARISEVRFVSSVLGRFDLLAIVLAGDAAKLSRLAHERVAALSADARSAPRTRSASRSTTTGGR